jgi:hypothetical protein
MNKFGHEEIRLKSQAGTPFARVAGKRREQAIGGSMRAAEAA